MEKPCIGCIVSACCSERCKDYAVYIYDIRDYEEVSPQVTKQINSMKYEDAIDHILMVENFALSIM